MPEDKQPQFDGIMRGTIWSFLSGNQFRVELSDGQLVDAFMPDELIEKILPYYTGEPKVARINVTVELRERPAMNRIIAFGEGQPWLMSSAKQSPRR